MYPDMYMLQVPVAIHEPQLEDAALPAYVSLDVGPHVLTWQIGENSTMRRKPKLCNSLGYSYTSQPAGKRGKFSSHI